MLKFICSVLLVAACSASQQQELPALDAEQFDDQQLDNQQLDDQQFNNQQLDDQQLDNQQFDNQQLDDQQLDDQQLDDQQLDDQQLDDQQLDNQQLDDQQLDDQQLDNQQMDIEQENDFDAFNNDGQQQQLLDQQLIDQQASYEQNNTGLEDQLNDQQLELPDSEATDPAEPVEPVIQQYNGLVHWIGYVYKPQESSVNVEIVTKNNPQFDIYQEVNQAKQKEIVVRFYKSRLRRKLRRDIDASEFRSPVAYVRTRDKGEGMIDVILTVRDDLEAKYLAQDGNVLLSFPIPSYYFGNAKIAADPADRAIDLATPLTIVQQENSKSPRSGRVHGYIFNREVFSEVDSDQMQDLPTNDISLNVSEPTNELPLDNETLDEMPEQEMLQQELPEQQQVPQQDSQQEQQSIPENESDFANREYILFQVAAEQGNAIASDEEAIDQPASSADNAASNFSEPQNISDGGQLEATNDSEQQNDLDQSLNNQEVNVLENNAEDLQLGEVKNNSENLSAIEDEELLVPLHGTEQIGQESAIEPLSSSDSKAVRLSFRDAPLSEVLHAIRVETGTNFIFPPPVGTRKIFLNLTNIPWDEALRALLEVNNLAMAKVGENLVRIDTLGAIESYKKQMKRIKIQAGRLQPTKIMIMKLSHAKAGTVQGMVRNLLGAVIKEDDRIRVETDQRTNSLLIEALPQDLAKIRVLVDRLDRQAPQVKIASRVVEILNASGNTFGISWGGPINYDQSRGLGFGSLVFPNFMTASWSIDGGGGTPGANNPESGNALGVSFGSLNDSLSLDLRLQMQETRGTIEVVQTNNVVVQDGKSATISTGTTRRVTVAGGGDQAGSIQSISDNISLNVTPQITADGSVEMQLSITSNTPSATGLDSTTRSVNTNLLRKSGETIAIGGLYTVDRTKSSQGMPILSSIPILGALFKSYEKNEARRELLVMVTPTIIEAGFIGDDNSSFDNQSNVANQFQENNQFQQNINNFNANNIDAEDPSDQQWQDNDDQFQQGNQQDIQLENDQAFGDDQQMDQQAFDEQQDQQQLNNNQQQLNNLNDQQFGQDNDQNNNQQNFQNNQQNFPNQDINDPQENLGDEL